MRLVSGFFVISRTIIPHGFGLNLCSGMPRANIQLSLAAERVLSG
jgi:hypothetical protein